MNSQRIIVGAAIGTAVAGIGFLLFHPSGKRFRDKAIDLGLDAADKLIEYIRTRTPEYQGNPEKSPEQAMAASVPGSM